MGFENRGDVMHLSVYKGLLAVFEKGRVFDWALELFDSMRLNEVVPDANISQSFIDTIGQSQEPERVLAVVRLMKRHGFEPSAKAYKAVARACKKSKDSTNVLEQLEMLKQLKAQ